MSPISLVKLPLSSSEGWPDLIQRRPGMLKVFGLLVLPLSLLPPAMLYFAGTHHPEVFPGAGVERNWLGVAVVFFLAEMVTLLGMGWLIRQVAATNSFAIDYHDAYLLAGIAPIPMWLSSLGLLVPDLTFNVLFSMFATALSCALIYQGVQALGRRHDEVIAAGIVQTVIGAGLVAWALLLVLAFASVSV